MDTKKYNPDIYNRRSIRLKKYDYTTAGLYFITICTENRTKLFGEIPVGAGSKPAHDNENNITNPSTMILNEYGKIVKNTWFDLTNHIQTIKLHEFIIMPNHIHGIIEIVGAGSKPAHLKPNNVVTTGAGLEPAPTGMMGQIGCAGDDCTGAGLEPAPTGTMGQIGYAGDDCTGAGSKPAPTGIIENGDKSLSEIVRQFKTFSAKRINQLRKTPGIPVWQRNYYEHIIRNEEAYYKISEYIINNPINWQEDKYFA